ncbi:glycoside hydrolase domain-containing protein [Streptomyces sp. NPDC056844]|uniref:glycoside hydrolase domain-containing protein n=1 Tax=unclassified Streptomyces TaxID=2593676 RepID=UPI0036CE5417
MADEMVLRAQRFINTTYGNGATLGISKLAEDGKTGWPVMYALTRALQYEMGITALSDAFGPATLAAIASQYGKLDETNIPSANFCRIIQSALYCKGYDGGEIDGTYNDRVKAAVAELHQNMGVAGTYPGSSLWPKTAKGLFNMDAYTTIGGGSDTIRAIQQWLNGQYVLRKDFYIIPCDGYHSRDVATSMLFAIQYELGMADGVANGVFGPGTQSGLKSHTVSTSVNATGVWARLFTAAMVLNKNAVAFGSFTEAVRQAVVGFQEFSGLPATGAGDFSTWASLLVSYGDQSRKGTACDGVTKITPEKGAALKAAGYAYVGRYLYNPYPDGDLPEKQIQPGELYNIKEAGLRCYPIYQTWSRSADYFSTTQGTRDAVEAINWARFHGFKAGTVIYFAVDYDAMDGEVTSYVVPHFRAVARTINENSKYHVGIYGARNVCQRVVDAGYASVCMVSDMSSGFSGNLGYPLPSKWSFDQISTITVGSGSGSIEIDNNIASGRDTGQGDFDAPIPFYGIDTDLDTDAYRASMLTDVQTYLKSIGVAETGGDGWTDTDWATLGGISTTEAYDAVVDTDALFTSLARTLKIRKALIQAPVMWELRKLNPLDFIADAAVQAGQKDDCSTGWGQIFAKTAIMARNYCIGEGIISGTGMDYDDKDDLKTVWDKLHNDQEYNIRSVAYTLIFNAELLGIPRPDLTSDDHIAEAVLGRYNGTGPAAEQYGAELMGLYRVLENYNALSRAV